MNRHQSNPFLAGWDADDEVQLNQGMFDMDATMTDADTGDLNNGVATATTTTTARRHSSSHADDSAQPANPFDQHRTGADRRLYHRNMSSFDAASSLQLEHQQQLENGAIGELANQTDLIAKMTAEFQTAIATNDKQFGDSQAHNEDAAILGNPFDPFETIVDDDISIPSPATSASGTANSAPNQAQRGDNNFFKQEGSSYIIDNNNNKLYEADRPQDIHIEDGANNNTNNLHDSIDDDDAELVSTPVRNIKSSSPPIHKNDELPDSMGSTFGDKGERDDNETAASKTSFNLNNQSNPENTDSIAKASLFASLLASAEQSDVKQQTIDDTNYVDDIDTGKQTTDTQIDADENINFDHNHKSAVSPIRQLETATHVIKGGSHLAGDGQTDRPIGFFDPFETVIDKDALTSLMNESSTGKATRTTTTTTTTDENYDSTATTTEKSKEGHPQATPDNRLDDSASSERLSMEVAATDAASVETVIENSPPEGDLASGSGTNTKLQSLPRPTRAGERNQQPISTPALPIKTPNKKTANKVKKKASFQEDSSDSSDSDDRIQIVIKARDVSQNRESQSGSTFVPLLPPPPSKSSMKQARERGQVEDMPSPVMSYKTRHEQKNADLDEGLAETSASKVGDSSDEFSSKGGFDTSRSLEKSAKTKKTEHRGLDGDDDEDDGIGKNNDKHSEGDEEEDDNDDDDGQTGQFVIPMTMHSDDEDYGKPDTPLYDEDTSYVLDEYPAKYEGPGWEMMLRYPPKKKLTSNRFWKKIFVKLAQVPLTTESKSTSASKQNASNVEQQQQQPTQMCIALQIFDKPEDKKPMQEIPIQATYTVSEISSQQFDQFGKIFTLKLQYIFYKERVGVRQGQLARFIHTGHIGSSTTSGGHGVDPISIGAIKRMGAPIEHSPQISQIIKLGCANYSDIKVFKNCLEDYLFKMPIHRDRALSTYKTEEVQMAVRDETHIELNQVGTIIKQLARVRLFFLSFLNGTPIVEVGINDIHRQGREVVGRMDILPVVTEEWIRLEACELHSTIEKEDFENPDSRMIKLVPPDATFFELMRFRIRPPRNRELPLQITANMTVTRTKVSINCEVMVPGCVSRKHGQIPCENIAIKIAIPECWIYFFREEKHFRMGSKKSVNRRPGKVKGIERFLGGGGLQDINDESSLIEVTSGQAKYEHHHHAIVWRAARWPKESQSAYVQNTMKIRLPLTAYDKMPETYSEFIHVEYTMPATTVSHTTLRSISVNPCDDEPPEKYVKYSAKYDYKVKMRLSVNIGGSGSKGGSVSDVGQVESSPIIIMKQPDLHNDLQREEDSDDSASDDRD